MKIHNKSHHITCGRSPCKISSTRYHDAGRQHLMEVSCKKTSLRSCTSFYHEQFNLEERHSTYPMDVPTMSWEQQQQQHHLLRVNIKEEKQQFYMFKIILGNLLKNVNLLSWKNNIKTQVLLLFLERDKSITLLL